MLLAIRFGATAPLTFVEARRLQRNLPTPWIGLWERIDISVFSPAGRPKAGWVVRDDFRNWVLTAAYRK